MHFLVERTKTSMSVQIVQETTVWIRGETA